MAELSLKQITDRLNAEFTGDSRKLVFWYDEKAEFAEDIDTMVLENAVVYHLTPDNQFRTKYFLERQDRTTNYLVYAPFPKPDVTENHLEDTLLYSRRFYADRASLLCVDLGIREQYKPLIEKHIKFFANKERTQRFYDLEIENYNEDTILIGLLSALCRSRVCSFEEVVRIVLTDGDIESNDLLTEFEKYGLTDAFWKFCDQQFGYTDHHPTPEKLLLTLFVTYTDKTVTAEIPASWKPFVSYKSGNAIAFLNSLMNSILYRERFDALSVHAAASLNVSSAIRDMAPEMLTDCDLFEEIDKKLILWMTERLLAEDIGAKLNGLSIKEVCEKRLKMHFGENHADAYRLIISAGSLIGAVHYACPDTFKDITDQYIRRDYLIDQEYRNFYYHLDRIENSEDFEQLRMLIENIYANEYLAVLLPKWSAAYSTQTAAEHYVLQRDFYRRRLSSQKEQTVVIISDAMRFEVGKELAKSLSDDPKCTSVKITPMVSTLPSYTRLGMAALLPHRTLTMTDSFDVLADGVLCNDLAGRQSVLQNYQPQSVCVRFDDIKNMKVADLRGIFNNKQVVYIYHNQIDARGDKPNTEDEVFDSCTEAISEITALIRRLSSAANKTHFMVTADHGFLYRRDKLTESDKIGGAAGKNGFINRRFVIANETIPGDGIGTVSLGDTLGSDDERIVSFPVGADIFKIPGGGMNYVHGGSSPQEMLIPLLDIRMEKGKVETRTAQIAMVSLIHKITNLITQIDFIQSDAVCDTVRAATYRLYFISESGDRVSNENTYIADRRDEDASKRVFRLKFTFKNQEYSRSTKYYLICMDEGTGVEAWRYEVTVDMAFAGDFGFGF